MCDNGWRVTNDMPPETAWSAIAEEVAGIGFWRMDSATGVVDWSPNMFRLFEFPFGPAPSAEQTRGMTVYDRNDRSARADLEPERLA